MAQGTESLALWLLPSGRLLENLSSKQTYSAHALSTREIMELCRQLSGQTPERGRAAMEASLVELGLLERGSHDPVDRPYGDLRLLRAGTHYWNYSDSKALQKDRDDMQAYEIAGSEQMRNHSAGELLSWCIPEEAQALLTLAHHVLDAQSVENFHHQRVHRKRVPSLGARHGITSFLSYWDSASQRTCCAQPLPDGATRTAPSPLTEEACRLFPPFHLVLCAQFERYQWRYRNSWIYQCIYLDLGHVLAAMQVYATHHSLTLKFAEVPSHLIQDDQMLVSEPLVIGFFTDRTPDKECTQ